MGRSRSTWPQLHGQVANWGVRRRKGQYEQCLRLREHLATYLASGQLLGQMRPSSQAAVMSILSRPAGRSVHWCRRPLSSFPK
jgi:hypothetical protein